MYGRNHVTSVSSKVDTGATSRDNSKVTNDFPWFVFFSSSSCSSNDSSTSLLLLLSVCLLMAMMMMMMMIHSAFPTL